jgi:2'-5' RNA ligase
MSKPLRLFIALELPSSVLGALETLQSDLRAQVPERAARWVRPAGIHLTLKFLGDVPAEQVDAITAGIHEATKNHAPFTLQAEGLGVFPNPRRARVLWVGVGGEIEALRNLHASVEEYIVPLGYPAEERKFRGHLTLARAARHASRAEQEALGELAARSDLGLLASWQVESVSLVRSQLKPGGAVYTQVAEAALTGQE